MTTMTIEAVRAASRRGRRPPILPSASKVRPVPTVVLGLDLAIQTTGWALLVGGRPDAHGVFTLPDRRRGEPLAAWLMRRAEELARQIDVLLFAHTPEIVGYEYPDSPRQSWSGGAKGREFHAVQGLSRAEGMLLALWPTCGRGLPLVAVPASEARRLATGRPGATKEQVAYALRTYRGWDLAGWGEDEVDAASVALAAREGITG